MRAITAGSRIFDDEESRAAWIPKSRNYPGFPTGISGEELLDLLREQAGRFEVEVIHSRVVSLKRTEEGFSASYAGGATRARKVLLATGIVDRAPAMDDLDQAVSAGSIRDCPVCDGYEATDRRAVLGSGTNASIEAEIHPQLFEAGYLASARGTRCRKRRPRIWPLQALKFSSRSARCANRRTESGWKLTAKGPWISKLSTRHWGAMPVRSSHPI